MSPMALLAAAAGAGVVTGLALMVAGLRPAPPAPEGSGPGLGGPPPWRRLARRLRDLGRDTASDALPDTNAPAAAVWGWRWPAALAAGSVIWLVTGWPVAGGIVAAGVVGVPVLVASGSAGARRIVRAEAVEEWTRRLSDVLVVGVGLEQAVAVTVGSCPAPIAGPVSDLSSRLTARWPVETALRAFADDLDDPAGDLVTAALILAARRRGPGLAKVLTGVADSLAEEVAMRRKVEAERAKPRTTARTVTAITVAVLAVAALNTTYLRPYGTPLGQLVLATLAAAFAACLAWMHSLGRGRPAPRVFTGPDRPAAGIEEAQP